MGQRKLIDGWGLADGRTTLLDDHENASSCCLDRQDTARPPWPMLLPSMRATGHSRSMPRTTDQPQLSLSAFRMRSTLDQDWAPREDQQPL